jgi:hypothetical protein
MRPAAFALVLLLAGGCTAAAEVTEPAAEMTAPTITASATPSVDEVTVDPCLLLTETEVETALSVTVESSRLQTDPLTRAFTFALPDRSCEYYGLPAGALETPAATAPPSDVAGPSDLAGPSDVAVPSEPQVDETLEALDAAVAEPSQDLLARARSDVERIEQQIGALELVVSVNPERLSREAFETYCERRLQQLAQGERAASEPEDLAAAVAGLGSRFVEEATDRATDVGGIGDAARWYPALAQLHVLVGDRAFVVTSLKQSPMMAAMLYDANVEPTYDPPPEFVELARLAAGRF